MAIALTLKHLCINFKYKNMHVHNSPHGYQRQITEAFNEVNLPTSPYAIK